MPATNQDLPSPVLDPRQAVTQHLPQTERVDVAWMLRDGGPGIDVDVGVDVA